MPRIRPLRKPEDIAAVPLDQEVTIDLSPEPVTAESSAVEPDKPAAKVDAPRAPEPQDDDDAAALRKQLDAAKAAEKAAHERAEAEARRREEAERRASEQEQNASRERDNSEQANYDGVLNGIAAMQSEIEAAQQAEEAAEAAQDNKAKYEARRRAARAEVALARYEEGKATLDARREEAKRNPPQRQNGAPTIEMQIDAMQGLTIDEKTWLKGHPDALSDPRRNAKLQASYWEAMDKGLARGTPEYFKFIEEQIGYRRAEPPPQDDDDLEPEPQPTRRTTPVAAPVSREVPSATTGRPSSQRITLSPDQREAAKISGISEVEYARQVQKLDEQKKLGNYQDRR